MYHDTEAFQHKTLTLVITNINITLGLLYRMKMTRLQGHHIRTASHVLMLSSLD